MAFQRIRIKNTNVAGKVPGADKLDTAELCVNLKDQKLYSKDADGNVFEIAASASANVPGGDTPPGAGNEIGDLFFDTTNNTLLYWDGSEWKPVVSGDTIGLDDLNDVTVEGATDGQILAYDQATGQWVAVDSSTITLEDIALNDLTDVTITQPLADGQVLAYIDATPGPDLVDGCWKAQDGFDANLEYTRSDGSFGNLSLSWANEIVNVGALTYFNGMWGHRIEGKRANGNTYFINASVSSDQEIAAAAVYRLGGNGLVCQASTVPGGWVNADKDILTDAINDGTLTIFDPNGDSLGTFTANQESDTDITIPAAQWAEIEGNPIYIGEGPDTPALGNIWVNTDECPPVIYIWTDCADPGNPIWTPIGGGTSGGCIQGPVQIIGDSELGSTLTATGGNGTDEGTGLTATYEWTGARTGSGSTIVADVEGDYTVTATITCVDGTELTTSATKTVSDSYVDMVNNTPPVIAVLGEGPDGAYEGNTFYVVTPATVINGDNPVIVENQWYRDGIKVATEQLYTISAADPEGSVLTCKQLFRDARTNEILSEASNGITIVARPADAITFDPVITDDGTANANKVGSTLTAVATNIVGGVAPIEYAFEWKSAGATVGTAKTYELQSTDVGKIIQCAITVAEPDGSNPEIRTATYTETIEVLGTINTPEVLAPADGAGSGDVRYLKSDAITEVEGGGIDTCETELIENVDDTTDAPNVISPSQPTRASTASS